MRHVGAGTCMDRNEGTTFVKSRGSAEVEPLYRHADAGTRGTEGMEMLLLEALVSTLWM